MSKDCLTERSEPLIAAASRERHQLLASRVREISGEMNGRGILHSNIHVNAVAQACAAELHEIASIAWGHLQRAHESCGRSEVEKVLPHFLRVLESESSKLDAALQAAIGTIAAGLQNKSMLNLQAVREARDHLVQKYKGEIDIYTANLSRGDGGALLERWKNRVKNNPLVAFLTVVAAGIAGVAAFTDALVKLDSFVRRLLLGDG